MLHYNNSEKLSQIGSSFGSRDCPTTEVEIGRKTAYFESLSITIHQ